MPFVRLISLCLFLLFLSGCFSYSGKDTAVEILNVSYDPTREFYREYNAWFEKKAFERTGKHVRILQSHGASGKQARFVSDGLEAHVVTLALAYDIDAIAQKSGSLSKDWQTRLPFASAPYTSTIVFLVRKGNPRNIQDWNDLIKPGVQVITPSPMTSGGARWNYLAAWGYAWLISLEKRGVILSAITEDERRQADEDAFSFVSALFRNVPVLDSGARAATTTFARRGIGDALVTWENEALLAMKSLPGEALEIITPSISILTEPVVAKVDEVTARRQTDALAQSYLEMLYSPEGQAMAARHHFRPRHMEFVNAEDKNQFPDLHLFTLEELFTDWQTAHKNHFSETGSFNKIYQSLYSLENQ
ncbi:MAG TPA: sulfate ABC transporter substrate-binding protein [Candidatus Hydrogenedentes bacterium]|jgi:sulfate transport system substrate-binding protein|nr:sulfate ABC transporter substrate-binding protein [Candidatus Hydrogenedentota bacterium]